MWNNAYEKRKSNMWWSITAVTGHQRAGRSLTEVSFVSNFHVLFLKGTLKIHFFVDQLSWWQSRFMIPGPKAYNRYVRTDSISNQ